MVPFSAFAEAFAFPSLTSPVFELAVPSELLIPGLELASPENSLVAVPFSETELFDVPLPTPSTELTSPVAEVLLSPTDTELSTAAD